MGQVDRKPVPVHTEESSYPFEARRRNIAGRVVLRFSVDRDGRTGNITVQESEPKGVFDGNAVEALRKWRFQAAQKSGRSVAVWMILPFAFKLAS